MYNHTVSYVQYFFLECDKDWNFRKSGRSSFSELKSGATSPKPALDWSQLTGMRSNQTFDRATVRYFSINNSNRILANWFKGNLGWSYCSYHSTGSWSFLGSETATWAWASYFFLGYPIFRRFNPWSFLLSDCTWTCGLCWLRWHFIKAAHGDKLVDSIHFKNIFVNLTRTCLYAAYLIAILGNWWSSKIRDIFPTCRDGFPIQVTNFFQVNTFRFSKNPPDPDSKASWIFSTRCCNAAASQRGRKARKSDRKNETLQGIYRGVAIPTPP